MSLKDVQFHCLFIHLSDPWIGPFCCNSESLPSGNIQWLTTLNLKFAVLCVAVAIVMRNQEVQNFLFIRLPVSNSDRKTINSPHLTFHLLFKGLIGLSTFNKVG